MCRFSLSGRNGGAQKAPSQGTPSLSCVSRQHRERVRLDVGLHQGTKRLQLRDHAKAEEEESYDDQGEEGEEQTAPIEGPRLGLWDMRASIRVLMTVHCAATDHVARERMRARKWEITSVARARGGIAKTVAGRNVETLPTIASSIFWWQLHN